MSMESDKQGSSLGRLQMASDKEKGTWGGRALTEARK